MGCDLSFINKITKKEAGTIIDGMQILEKKVLLLGLQNTGKTSLLKQFKNEEFGDTVPTVGLNVEQISYRSYSLTMWDVGGQATKLWKHYFDHIDAIIFVVDSTCPQNHIDKSKRELIKLSKDQALNNVPILLMLNK